MRRALTPILAGVVGVLVISFSTVGLADAAPNSGESSPCSAAAAKIGEAENLTRATFWCDGTGVVSTKGIASATDNSRAVSKEFIGNISTGQHDDVTSHSGEQKSAVSAKYSSGSNSKSLAPAGVTDPCFSYNGSTEVIPVDDYHARGNVNICYGEYITHIFAPTEIVWSEWLRYQVNQGLTNRMNQEIRWVNTLSTDNPDVQLHWDLRWSIINQTDPYYGPAEVEQVPNFGAGWSTASTYGIQYGDAGVLHLTHAQTDISAGAHNVSTISTYPNVRMPDFDCPASTQTNPEPCIFV